jgi:hypothetical protein
VEVAGLTLVRTQDADGHADELGRRNENAVALLVTAELTECLPRKEYKRHSVDGHNGSLVFEVGPLDRV